MVPRRGPLPGQEVADHVGEALLEAQDQALALRDVFGGGARSLQPAHLCHLAA
jgi:hypothetical protein